MGAKIYLPFIIVVEFCFFSVLALDEITEMACGPEQPAVFGDESGNIYSPGYQEGSNYGNDLRCSYMILGETDKVMEVTVIDSDIEASTSCKADQIRFRGGRGLLKTLCGSLKNYEIFSNDTWMTVYFNTDFMTTGRGFNISYRLKTANESKYICGTRQFRCLNAKCVPRSAVCDEFDQCGDGSDEANCPRRKDETFNCGVPPIFPDLSYGEDRVVGGNEAVPGSWPWQVDLQMESIYPGGHVCGGTLLNHQWILSAAHCFATNTRPEEWRVRLGGHHKFSTDGNEQIRRVERIVIYGVSQTEFEETGWYNEDDDIALLKLNSPVLFTNTVQPVCLPLVDEPDVPAETKCFSTGWGDTRGSGHGVVLKQLPLEVFPMEKCRNQFIRTSNLTLVCAGSRGGFDGLCHGDSGGPLVCQSPNGSWKLIGVTSFLTQMNILDGVCAVPNSPSGFTKVSFRMDWIQRTIRIYG